jgi:hypothetical protein
VGAVRVKDRGSKLAAGEFEDEEFGIIPRQFASAWDQEEEEEGEEGGLFIGVVNIKQSCESGSRF